MFKTSYLLLGASVGVLLSAVATTTPATETTPNEATTAPISSNGISPACFRVTADFYQLKNVYDGAPPAHVANILRRKMSAICEIKTF